LSHDSFRSYNLDGISEVTIVCYLLYETSILSEHHQIVLTTIPLTPFNFCCFMFLGCFCRFCQNLIGSNKISNLIMRLNII